MQRVIEFKKKSWWSGGIDTVALNEKIAALNGDGWQVKSMVANTVAFGRVDSYSLLIELQEAKK
ncbi:hypothetical protein AAEU28_12575 [Pseudoalteromonas sp. SS15]|uniref:hypothetical protein n=1 Tax=Pseudoalteromonas sp. SS15 TaxID=3139393 RepID=UPI003BAD7792